MNEKPIVKKLNRQDKLNLDLITEFNPALIYAFECEASVLPERDNPTNFEYLFHSTDQYFDMFNAYLYAQNEILPKLKQGMEDLTPETIIYWIDQIHLRIANTLAKDQTTAGVKGVIAGDIVSRQIYRFHFGVDFKDYVNGYLSGYAPPGKNIVDFLSDTFHIQNKEKIAQLLQLLDDIRKQHVSLPESEKKYIDWESTYVEGTVTMTKLAILYHANELNAQQKELIDYFMTICPPSPSFPGIRQKFSKNLLSKLKALNPEDIEQVIDLAFTAFYEITEYHWYFNGNGRTATCFMNVLLRAVGQPSIMMRHPDERENPESSYSMAIANIKHHPELLKSHIKCRLAQTNQGESFENLKLRQKLENGTKMVSLARDIISLLPEINITNYYQKKLAEYFENHVIAEMTDEDRVLDIGAYVINQFSKFKDSLTLNQIKNKYLLKDTTTDSLQQGLRRAAANSDVANVSYLIKFGLKLNDKDTNPTNGSTALHWAVKKSSYKVAKRLVKAGAKSDIPDALNKTAKQYAEEQNDEKMLRKLAL